MKSEEKPLRLRHPHFASMVPDLEIPEKETKLEEVEG